MSRDALDRDVLAWMGEPWDDSETRFNELALRLFRHQFEHCGPYRAFCESRDVRPEALSSWTDIPCVPTGAFKSARLCGFDEKETAQVFRTSGTTGSTRGALYLDTTELYEASLRASFARGVLPDVEEPVRMIFLAPSLDEASDSSLSYMFEIMRRERGDRGSAFFLHEGALAMAPLRDALQAAEACEGPVLVAGTAFAFVHLLDGLEADKARVFLGAKARVMETGGFKGRSREIPRNELYGAIANRLGVPEHRIVNQYGMTELGSQFYDSVLTRPGVPRHKQRPPWTRVQVTHPENAAACAPGEVGMISIFDLANTGSVLAVQTADLGRELGAGFEVLGRSSGSDVRGCSVAADAQLIDTKLVDAQP